MNRIESITYYATKFRKAMEKAHYNNEFARIVTLASFPRGSCGISSELLHHYLSEKGIKTKIVCKTYYDENDPSETTSHAWLEYEDIIIDITGDQFKYYPLYNCFDKPVYIGKLDSFHKIFSVEGPKVDFNEDYYDKSIYKIVERYL